MTKKLTSYRFDQSTLDMIEEIKKELGLPSDTAVLRKALAFMERVKQAENNGGELIFVNKDGTRKSMVFI